VTEIDGVTNATATIKVGVHPEWIAADPVTGKVFVSNSDGSSLSIIDCASRSVKNMIVPAGPRQVAVNPASGKAYLACYTAGRAVVIDQTVEQDARVVCYDLMAGNPWQYKAGYAFVNYAGYAVNRWSPEKTNIMKAMYRLPTFGQEWHFAHSTSPADSLCWTHQSFTWPPDSIYYGENFMSYSAIETQGSASNNMGAGTPFVGNVTTQPLYRIDYVAPNIAWWDSLADDNNSLDGYGPYTVRAVITDFSGVDYATLYYQMSGKSWPSVAMTRAAADTFIAQIPAQIVMEGDTAVMSYMINTGDHATSINNNSNAISSNTRTFNLRNLTTGVGGNPADPTLPKAFALQAAYPNPSRGQTTIKYQLPRASNVQLQVYNIAGQLVQTIDEGQRPAGYHQVRLNGNAMSNGIYFYRLQAGEFSATRKMIVLR
jgi:hypothetical protein